MSGTLKSNVKKEENIFELIGPQFLGHAIYASTNTRLWRAKSYKMDRVRFDAQDYLKAIHFLLTVLSLSELFF